jgi:hypothetical protein
MFTREQFAIARICHEANRVYCESIGDFTQREWDFAELWQRESAVKGVAFAQENPTAPASAQHDAWMADKVADGWVYGPVKNPATKEHPCIIPYDGLPLEQRRKDALFKAIVNALSE